MRTCELGFILGHMKSVRVQIDNVSLQILYGDYLVHSLPLAILKRALACTIVCSKRSSYPENRDCHVLGTR